MRWTLWNQRGTGLVLQEHLLQPPVGFSIPGEDLSIFGTTRGRLGSVTVLPMDAATRSHWNVPKSNVGKQPGLPQKAVSLEAGIRKLDPRFEQSCRADSRQPTLWGRHKCLIAFTGREPQLADASKEWPACREFRVKSQHQHCSCPNCQHRALLLLWPWTLLLRITYNNKGAFWVILLEIHQAV